MRKYALVGVGILLTFALFRWNGTESGEQAFEKVEEVFTYETAFSAKQHVMERLQRLDLMQKAIKLPTYIATNEEAVTFSAKVTEEDTSITWAYRLEDAGKWVLTIATDFSHFEANAYKKTEWGGQVGWLNEAEDRLEVIIENEGLYYALVGSKEKEEEMVQALHSLQETDLHQAVPFERMKLPTVFPGHLLVVDEVSYTNEPKELLTVTYVMKEEYTITYNVQKDAIEHADVTWKKVKTPNSGDMYYAKEESRLLFKDDLYHYEISSSGRELSLEEFLLMTK